MSKEEISLVAFCKTALILERGLLLALYVASAAITENLGLRSTWNSKVFHWGYLSWHDSSLHVHCIRNGPLSYLVNEVLLWLKNVFGLAEVTLDDTRFVDDLACRCANYFIGPGGNNTVVCTLMRSCYWPIYRLLLLSNLKHITLQGQIGWRRCLKRLRKSTCFNSLAAYLECWNISILWGTWMHWIRIVNLILKVLRLLVRWGHVYD